MMSVFLKNRCIFLNWSHNQNRKNHGIRRIKQFLHGVFGNNNHFSFMVWHKVPSRILTKTFQTFEIITHISKLAYETCESDIERINLM